MGSTAVLTAAIAVERSENNKTGAVSATYTSQTTCPPECPFRNNGCYAEESFAGIHTRRLNAVNAPHLEATAQEAAAIDRLSARRDLRLHVVGDARTTTAAGLLADAASRYIRRAVLRGTGWVRIWTYTHSWRRINRKAWGKNISVLASCESTDDIKKARTRGYATALVVKEHTTEVAYEEDGLKLVPCPEQTRGIQCVNCRLCMNDSVLIQAGITIAFAAHGSRVKRVQAAIR